MPTYRPRDVVDVQIKAARVVSDDGFNLVVSYERTTGGVGILRLPSNGIGIEVDHLASGEWPPQVGDLWVSGEENGCRTTYTVLRHDHTDVCHKVGCDYTVDFVDTLDTDVENPHRYPIGRTAPVFMRPLRLTFRESPAVAS